MENQENQQEQQQAQPQSGEPNGQVKNEGLKAAQTSEDETLNDDIGEDESADFDSDEEEDFSVAGVNDEKAKQKSNVSGGQGTMGNNQSNITQQPNGV